MQSPLFTGAHHIHLSEVGSTNTYLKELITYQNLPEGTVVTSSNQFGGRGQMGAIWESEPDSNIILSVLYYPKFLKADEQFYLSMSVALAVRDFIISLLPDEKVEIKWPNDILVNSKKICGILIENSLANMQLSSSVVGIGINVNEQMKLPTAISLHQVTGRIYDIKKLNKSLFASLEKYYLKLKRKENQKIEFEYLSCLLGYEKEMSFTDTKTDEKFSAFIAGVADDGSLLLSRNEKIEKFGIKEIAFVLE